MDRALHHTFLRRLPREVLVCAACAVVLSASGCVANQPVISRPPTLGSELISLDAARDCGLLTHAEYTERRAETIALWIAIATTPVQTRSTEVAK
ncbi:MAG: hypothetical protein DWH96_08750 [Planctomycetota bacterium]|nr:MAG: hypothetical protein DWH96_08750 [Planctomycetota bacterium]